MTTKTLRHNHFVRTHWLAAIVVLTLFCSVGCSQGGVPPTQFGATSAPSEVFESAAPDVIPEVEISMAGANAAPLPQELFTLRPTFRLPDVGCDLSRPVRIQPFTDVPGEHQYIDEITVCQSVGGDHTAIKNNSPVVWRFVDRLLRPVSVLVSSPKSAAFREMVVSGNLYSYASMAPGETMLLSGFSFGYQWFIHPALTKAWLGYDVLHRQIMASGMRATRSLLTKKSTSMTALFDCTLAFYSAVDTGRSIASQDEEALLGGFTVAASAGTCVTSWKAAEIELGRKNFPSLVDDVAKVGKVATNVSKLRVGWGWLRAACSAIPKIC